MIRFGPAGNSDSFKTMGYKNAKGIPEYLTNFGLNAFEYQCGRGVRISEDSARELGVFAKLKGISMSVHAPYYISLSSTEEEKRLNSINYILQSARAVDAMGGNRIVIHCGSCTKMTREQATDLAKDTIAKAVVALDKEGFSHIHMCIETMGKVNQLGDTDEVLEICSVDDRILPCIDFGHLNARTFGGLKEFSDYKLVFDKIHDKLGMDRLKIFHSHFSKIEYTTKGGEKKHLTFEDTVYGPNFDPIAELTAKLGLTPTFICESDGTQAEDARTMMELYNKALKI